MTTAEVSAPPILAVPPRPARPLSTLQLMQVVQANSLSAWAAEVFEELFVQRRYFWGRLVVVSDPDGVRRILQDNYDNYPRLAAIRRMFEFDSGSGIFCAEGDGWRRHRRLLNRTLDARALLEDFPGLVAMGQAITAHLAGLPRGA